MAHHVLFERWLTAESKQTRMFDFAEVLVAMLTPDR
jgi:hypothetical protein